MALCKLVLVGMCRGGRSSQGLERGLPKGDATCNPHEKGASKKLAQMLPPTMSVFLKGAQRGVRGFCLGRGWIAVVGMLGRVVKLLVGWLVVVCYFFLFVVGWLVGWLVGRLVGWLVVCMIFAQLNWCFHSTWSPPGQSAALCRGGLSLLPCRHCRPGVAAQVGFRNASEPEQ